MPTPAEKKALLFLASVILLGASVRALRAVGTIEKVPTGNIHALDGQLAAVDSARRVKHGGAKGRTLRGRHRLPPDSLPARDTLRTRLPNGAPTRALPGGKIDVDTATAEQLDALPGVGPVTAQKILDYRQQHGAFASVEELDAVPGIGPARLEQLKDLVAP